MQDTIIKGTGNSRTLASVPNFLTLYPTYEAFAQALIAGELPIDMGPINPAGCEIVGTPLDKAHLWEIETGSLVFSSTTDGLRTEYDFFCNVIPHILFIVQSKGGPKWGTLLAPLVYVNAGVGKRVEAYFVQYSSTGNIQTASNNYATFYENYIHLSFYNVVDFEYSYIIIGH